MEYEKPEPLRVIGYMEDDLASASIMTCVQHRDGWCALAKGIREYDGMNNVPTQCDHVVTLPYGFEERKPDCPDCLRKLAMAVED